MASSGLESNESNKMAGTGIAMCFPANDSLSPSKIPRRLRRRHLESRCLSTAEEIEAKLKEADLRRQQFYELLTSKARSRERTPLSSSSREVDDLGQRLEAKLNAAEQKRLSILAKEQMRLARLDELRQAAKSGLEMRFEKERGELGMRLESRIRKAEINRLLILKSFRQQRAARKERATQSLMRRMTQESKYRESVRAAIYQKRSAAERKRLGFLEAERSKAHARLVRVKRAANSVNTQQEMERVKKKDQLEDRLRRARRQRAELLMQRKSASCSFADAMLMHDHDENPASKILRCWRQFSKLRGTTYSLAKNFDGLNINQKSVKSMPFEQLALQIESNSTLKAVKSLFDRLEVHLRVRQGTSCPYRSENIDHLLKRVTTPKGRLNLSHTSKSGGQKRALSGRENIQSRYKLSRYPMRIVLCAYMILGHPDAVLSGKGANETALGVAAVKFLQEFELLIKIIMEGRGLKSSLGDNHVTFRSQLGAFDKAWCSYLYQFTVWKVKDAKLLEEDLVRVACQLELSMMNMCKVTAQGDNNALTDGIKTIQKQVVEDQSLLKANVHNLSGDAGVERMESALSDVRTKFFASKESGNQLASPVHHISSPDYSCSSDSDGSPSSVSGVSEQLSNVARSLFKEDGKTEGHFGIPSPSAGVRSDIQPSNDIMSITENELLVNEIVHDHRHGFADKLDITKDDENGIKAKIKETIENAFWDGIMESLKQEQPDFSCVLKLMTEVRDELCEMSPGSWRQEITETIDIDILSQVLRCETLDMKFLGKILEYSLVTLKKLSAPANDEEVKAAHDNLLREVREVSQTGNNSNSSFAIAVIKGLRFVLQQIQTLKREISRARIRMIEPMIKGSAGLEYLQKAFSNRYGHPSEASISLPLTKSWLSLVKTDAEQQWGVYVDMLATLPTTSTRATHPQGLPSTTIRAGGSISGKSRMLRSEPIATGKEQPECRGEGIDLLVRVGLLKLVNEIEGLVQETMPETLKLNVSRLRTVQSSLQKIIVICTSMLVFRQTLLGKHSVTSPSNMENLISQSAKHLSELLDEVEDVSTLKIIETLIALSDNHISNPEEMQSRKEVMENLLKKSLKAGDPIFTRVSQAIYLATKGAVLGGTGSRGRQLVEMKLRPVGAALLAEKVMEAAEVLIMVANISEKVHGSWYDQLLKNM